MAKILAEYGVSSEGVPAEIAIVRDEADFIDRYELRHTRLKPATAAALSFLKEKIIEGVNIRISEMLDPRENENIRKRIVGKARELVQTELAGLNEEEEGIIVGRLAQEMMGLGELELILADENLEEVVINSAKEPVWVYHKKFGWLKTNLAIPNEETIHNYSSIIGRKVGRQITNLDPLMDAHLITGDRVNATLYPISTKGNALTIRKFARDPWTVISLIQNKTISSEATSLLWLAMQYELSVLIAGGTASGKTSFLNSVLVFTPPNQRVISIEDSVTGEAEMLVRTNGIVTKTSVGKLIDSFMPLGGGSIPAPEGIEVPAMDKNGKISFKKPSRLIRHFIKRQVLDVEMASGRKISITPDHSLFTLDGHAKISPVMCSQLVPGSFVATPRVLNCEQNIPVTFDLRNYRHCFEDCFVKSQKTGEIIRANKTQALEMKSPAALRHSAKKGIASAQMLMSLAEPPADARMCSKLGTSVPIMLEIDEEIASLCGLWLGDGSYDVNSILFTVEENECVDLIKSFASKFGANATKHSDGHTTMVNSKPLKIAFEKVLGLTGDSYSKRLPDWFWNLPEKEAAAFLRGVFTAEAWVRENDLAISLASPQLLRDLQTALLRFGIPLRISWKGRKKDKCFEARISGTKFLRQFNEKIGFTQLHKQASMHRLLERESHDVSDIVPLPMEAYHELKRVLKAAVGTEYAYKGWKSWLGRFRRGQQIGREHLKKIVGKYAPQAKHLAQLAENDLLWDRVKSVTPRDYEGWVYDFSVPEGESFVCENIVAHNTRELILPDFLHWTPMTTRQANPEGKGKITMLDLMVNSLRMRPDRIVLGEIRRQREAEVLFEAMHTGHSVYSTLHADDASQVRNRLTNPPIGLPESVLGALHMVVVQYRQRRTGVRRSFEIAEVMPGDEGVSMNIVYKWDARDDELRRVGDILRVTNELAMHTGLSQNEISADLEKKQAILNCMVEKNISKVNDVGRIVGSYYRTPEEVVELAQKGQLIKLLVK